MAVATPAAVDFEPDAKSIHFASGALLFAWEWSTVIIQAAHDDDPERAREGLWRLTESIGAVRTFVFALCRQFKATQPNRFAHRGREYSSAHLAMLDEVSCLYAAACTATVGTSEQGPSTAGNGYRIRYPRAPRGTALAPDWTEVRDQWSRLRRTIQAFGDTPDDACDARDSLRRDVQAESALAILAVDNADRLSADAARRARKRRLPSVQEKMMDVLCSDPASKSWSAYEFAQHLGCQPTDVKSTIAWKEIVDLRVRTMKAH